MFEGRLKFLREQKGITMKKLASDLNMPYTTYINYEKNTREPNSEVLISIADYFNVTTDYLLGHNVSGVILDNASFTGDEQQIVSLYKELDIEDRAEIRGTIKGMLKNEKYTSVQSRENQG